MKIALALALAGVLFIAGAYYYLSLGEKTSDSPKVAAARSLIVGSWRGVEDPLEGTLSKSTTEYRLDGTYVETDESGEVLTKGAWTMLSSLEGTEFDDETSRDDVYIKDEFGNYFGVEVSDTNLTLTLKGLGASVYYVRAQK